MSPAVYLRGHSCCCSYTATFPDGGCVESTDTDEPPHVVAGCAVPFVFAAERVSGGADRFVAQKLREPRTGYVLADTHLQAAFERHDI